MKIEWIEFENLSSGLKIKRVDFFEDITLLVGLSGSGKTQILRAVKYIISLGVNKLTKLESCKASIGVLCNGHHYTWHVHIDKGTDDFTFEETCRFYKEELYCDTKLLLKRDNDDIFIEGYDRVPTPKTDESLVLQYSAEPLIRGFILGIRAIRPVEVDIAVYGAIDSQQFLELREQVYNRINISKTPTIAQFQALPVIFKLHLAKSSFPDVYAKIFADVKDLFLEIEDLDVVEYIPANSYVIAMKVYGKWLYQHDISNGMLKSIHYIVELYTTAPNSLVLIDEFENGLGVNCIDVLSDTLLNTRDDLQFIITSHHPSIINNIDSAQWRIIERDALEVSNFSDEDYGINHSMHDPFFNLINRWKKEGRD